jgi:hypothetical protein
MRREAVGSVYVPAWARELIRRHYGACGLEGSVLQLIEGLPVRMRLELGKSEEFWRRELEDPASKIHSLNLLQGAIERAVNSARGLSERTGLGICKYLRDSIERDWIGGWMVSYVRAMLKEYYGLP